MSLRSEGIHKGAICVPYTTHQYAKCPWRNVGPSQLASWAWYTRALFFFFFWCQTLKFIIIVFGCYRRKWYIQVPLPRFYRFLSFYPCNYITIETDNKSSCTFSPSTVATQSLQSSVYYVHFRCWYFFQFKFRWFLNNAIVLPEKVVTQKLVFLPIFKIFCPIRKFIYASGDVDNNHISHFILVLDQ